MVSVLRKGLLWLAGALLLAHSVVPHGHAEPIATGEHETHWNVSTSELPGHPLEADLGADHLENFRVDDQTLALSFSTDGEADAFVRFTSEASIFKKTGIREAYALPTGEPCSSALSRLFFLAAGGNRPPPPTV
jgi:hypothetical protein